MRLRREPAQAPELLIFAALHAIPHSFSWPVQGWGSPLRPPCVGRLIANSSVRYAMLFPGTAGLCCFECLIQTRTGRGEERNLSIGMQLLWKFREPTCGITSRRSPKASSFPAVPSKEFWNMLKKSIALRFSGSGVFRIGDGAGSKSHLNGATDPGSGVDDPDRHARQCSSLQDRGGWPGHSGYQLLPSQRVDEDRIQGHEPSAGCQGALPRWTAKMAVR